MSEGATLDVVGIGNAIVDVLAHAEDAFIDRRGITKGAMTLIDEEQARNLYGEMAPGVESSGGSAANTIAGLASFGADCAFIGKVRDDQLGEIFGHDMRSLGVRFETTPAKDGPSTARCLVLVTPDAQRTMNTYLGACVGLGPDDVDAKLVAAAQVTYLEGYLWDPPQAKEAFRKAIDAAHAAGRRVALTLSDPFCVDRYRSEFRALAEGGVDIVFANEEEIKSLYQVESFDEGMNRLRGKCELAALTRGKHGSVLLDGDEVHVIDAHPAGAVVDTTGAGDLYAAGVLYGLCRDLPMLAAGRLGSLAASEVISHFGPRPEARLETLARTHALIG